MCWMLGWVLMKWGRTQETKKYISPTFFEDAMCVTSLIWNCGCESNVESKREIISEPLKGDHKFRILVLSWYAFGSLIYYDLLMLLTSHYHYCI